MDCFQKDCVEYDLRLKDFLVPVRKAHITLLALHISKQDMEEAKDIFNNVIEEKNFDDGIKFEVTFEGVGSFNDRVVYAEPIRDWIDMDKLEYMNDELYRAFTERAFTCEPNFTPHLTLMKMGYKKKKGNDLNKIPSKSYEQLRRKYFGIQEFSGIQLLSMTKAQTKEGYYFCEEEYKFRKKICLKCEEREIGERKEHERRTTRGKVTDALKNGFKGNVGTMVAGFVTGAAFIWGVNRMGS